MRIPILFIGDSPDLPSGLARIGNDLASRLCRDPRFEVGYLGLGGVGLKSSPYRTFTIQPQPMDFWGAKSISPVVQKFFGDRRGVVFSVWDPMRVVHLGMPGMAESQGLQDIIARRKILRWGYFAIDATGPFGKPSGFINDIVRGFDRQLFYTKWAKDQFDVGDWIPHGLNPEWFTSGDRAEGRKIIGASPEPVVVGVVGTNNPRKDWGLTFASFKAFQEQEKNSVLWAHIDLVRKYWDINALVQDFGLGGKVVVTGAGYDDKTLASLYKSCDVTFCNGSGEGFGYPIVESLACFPAGTLVTTPTGLVAIEDLKVGQLVVSHTGVSQPIQQVHLVRQSTELVSINVYDHPEIIRATPEHPFLTLRQGVLDWRPARELTTNDYVAVAIDQSAQQCLLDVEVTVPCVVEQGRAYPQGRNAKAVFAMRSSHSLPAQWSVDAGLGRLLGYWIAEGWTGKGEITFAFGYDEDDLATDCAELCRTYLGVHPRVQCQKQSLRVSFTHALFSRLLIQWFGSGARVKTLPEWLIHAPWVVVEGFLLGAWLGDGTTFIDRAQYARCSYSTASPSLAWQMRRLLHRAGVTSSLYRGQQKAFSQNPIFQVRVTGRSAEVLGEVLGRPILRGRTTHKNRVSFIKDGYAFYAIREVSQELLEVPVYNLAVAIDESYHAGGIVVHNCGTPCVHGNYGGGAELLPQELLVEPEAYRYEGLTNAVRPVFNPYEVAKTWLRALEMDKNYLPGLVQHLRWDRLWPVWLKWYVQGIEEEWGKW